MLENQVVCNWIFYIKCNLKKYPNNVFVIVKYDLTNLAVERDFLLSWLIMFKLYKMFQRSEILFLILLVSV